MARVARPGPITSRCSRAKKTAEVVHQHRWETLPIWPALQLPNDGPCGVRIDRIGLGILHGVEGSLDMLHQLFHRRRPWFGSPRRVIQQGLQALQAGQHLAEQVGALAIPAIGAGLLGKAPEVGQLATRLIGCDLFLVYLLHQMVLPGIDQVDQHQASVRYLVRILLREVIGDPRVCNGAIEELQAPYRILHTTGEHPLAGTAHTRGVVEVDHRCRVSYPLGKGHRFIVEKKRFLQAVGGVVAVMAL